MIWNWMSRYNGSMGALLRPRLSVEEYLAIDRAAEAPSEYHDGEMFPVETASLTHARLLFKIGRRFSERLDGSPCEVAGATIRVRVSPSKYLYPDVIVYCGKPELTDEHQDTISNPKVIVEILSPSTEGYDYGKKFVLYRGLPSFEEYLLVSQDEPRVEVSRRTPENRWLLTTYSGLDAVVQVESLGISIPMTELYDGVEFEPTQ